MSGSCDVSMLVLAMVLLLVRLKDKGDLLSLSVGLSMTGSIDRKNKQSEMGDATKRIDEKG